MSTEQWNEDGDSALKGPARLHWLLLNFQLLVLNALNSIASIDIRQTIDATYGSLYLDRCRKEERTISVHLF